MLTETQIAARKKGIGGSDMPIVLGLSKWMTARELYHIKRGEMEREVDPSFVELLEWGHYVEPYIRSRYARRTGHTVRQPEHTLWHPTYSWMCGHPDGLVVEKRRVFEAKTVVPALADEFGEPGTDHVPQDYLIQVQQYLMLTGYEMCDLLPMVGRWDFRLYHIAADYELQDMMIEGGKDFMRRVLQGDPPPIDYHHRNAIDIVKRCHPGTNGQRIVATDECVSWRAKMQEAAKSEKDAKELKEMYRAQMLDYMGEAAFLAFPDKKAYRRKLIEKAEYTVSPSSYMDFRQVNDPFPFAPSGAKAQ